MQVQMAAQIPPVKCLDAINLHAGAHGVISTILKYPYIIGDQLLVENIHSNKAMLGVWHKELKPDNYQRKYTLRSTVISGSNNHTCSEPESFQDNHLKNTLTSLEE